MKDLFANYAHIIIFLHVLGAFVWVGGMIAVRAAVHPALQSIEDPKVRLETTLRVTGRLFALVAPFILLILLTGLVMVIALDGHHGANKTIFIAKEGIWTVMALNYLFMVFKRARAWKLFQAGDPAAAKAQVANIPNLLLPINILLGVVALWLGITLRGV
ncbi:hypothetical protein [Nitratifractor salsuginis]|uniref:Copper resistance protein D domain-containing protein n=1 Tax=Nitratifractor salsuginis (strain DSM 16511 / JCM 12458 / E9I37-1) TaxID=749222 RepID=E6X0H2_NITSE|nr:hypothetical protein [Nitratifractor salsuginis]ADV46822.1 hypothetical protein Nitsa_1574 [Nitratifractor salsuginis DSM 16511]